MPGENGASSKLCALHAIGPVAPQQLTIEVRDDGDGAASAAANGVGYGLVGIRERVKLYGGEMSAGRARDGGFVLTTRLPVTGYTR